MKKMLFGLLAIVIATASVAFTNKYEKKIGNCPFSPSAYWFHVNSSITPAPNCGSVDVTTQLDQLPVADGATDTDPFNNMAASINDPWSCPNSSDPACALAYKASTAHATDYEVVNIGTQLNPDYRWRPKASTTITCCVKRN